MSDQQKTDSIFDALIAEAMYQTDPLMQTDLNLKGPTYYKKAGQGGGRYIESEDIYEPIWLPSGGYTRPSGDLTGGQIDVGPNINDILRDEGLATWKEVGEGVTEDKFQEYLKRRSEGVISRRVPEVELPGKREIGSITIPKREPGPIETKRLPDQKPPKKEQKTGEIPWDRAPKVGTDARKKFYDQYNLRYDDTIKGYNRDGSRVEPVRRDDSSEKTATSRKKSRKRDSKKSRGRKGLNLPDLAWDFSDWDRPIREFFGQ